ncbi:hypothetical protein PQI07_27045 [Methylobacterium sp. 092160098-2]|jgi:hypothetical protein|uniref:hypothetical protein n=1 Tax=Methylobacterium sp. 092160098-2 TaxID=3025129 RepID=UPI002381C2EA|nr:hypothetical protein [Methylobacterium sp. 092160098-2]MDE4914331.1 hypothetical protein [Methylobacterium sp. 092160098-2]
MTGSEQKMPNRAKVDQRPKLGIVASRRIGSALRDRYEATQGPVPSKLHELLEKLDAATADDSAAA